jgi:hypothetical protein
MGRAGYCAADSTCQFKPSGVMRRARRSSFSRDACPALQTACQLKPGGRSFECLDLSNELTACGTCDNDCMLLPGVAGVAVRPLCAFSSVCA